MSYYLVTGGAGFIGSNIALRLAKTGARVRVFDNFASGMSRKDFDSIFHSFGDQVDVLEGDVRDAEACSKAVDGITHVLHHASVSSAMYSIENPVETLSVNVVGTANMLVAARDSGTVERFINASSCAVYGDGSSNAKTESGLLYPGTPFATSMHACESLCTNFFRSHKLCTASLRYFNVYGPSELTTNRPRSSVAQFIDAPLRGRDVVVYGSGSQTRDFIHIDDAVEAALKLCECDSSFVGGHIYNIGTGERISVIDLLELISALSGRHIDCVSAAPRRHEMQHSKADTVKAFSILGFTARISISEGVGEMLAVANQNLRAA